MPLAGGARSHAIDEIQGCSRKIRLILALAMIIFLYQNSLPTGLFWYETSHYFLCGTRRGCS